MTIVVFVIYFQDRFDTETPVSELKRNDEPKRIWQSENRQQIGELFIGFLKYFSKDFRFENSTISSHLVLYLLEKYLVLKNSRSAFEKVV